jgi:hypothetical protein
MAKKTDFDIQTGHIYFSSECFNRAWDYIDKPRRSKSEEDQMLQLCLSSLWHWKQREDCTATNLSIGYWQVSRVFALLRHADDAKHYGELSLEAAEDNTVEPFYRGYAYEALARAEQVSGNDDEIEKYMIKAYQIAATLTNPEEKKQLLDDLSKIR